VRGDESIVSRPTAESGDRSAVINLYGQLTRVCAAGCRGLTQAKSSVLRIDPSATVGGGVGCYYGREYNKG